MLRQLCPPSSLHSSDDTKRLCMKHTMMVDEKEKPKVVDKSDLCGEWKISDMINGIKLN